MAFGLLGPLLGGVASLASTGSILAAGAMGASARVLQAGVGMAGLTYNIGSDIVGATTGLAKGVGKAVGVEPEKDTTGSDEQGAKALPPGVKLNKNGVMVQDRGAKGGGQVLPGQFDDDGMLMSLEDRLGSMEAPDRGDAGPVQQILDYVKVIAANTARTSAGVGMMASSMSFGSSQSNIDDEKPPEQTPTQGAFGKMFGGLGKTMKAMGSSLGKTAKFMIKGLALGGLLYLFLNKKDAIQTSLAGVFKYFHELYEKVKNSDDPIQALLDELKIQFKRLGDAMMTMFKEFYTKTIEPMLDEMFQSLKRKVEDFVGDALSFVFGTDKQKKMTKYSKTLTSTNNTLTNLANELIKDGGSGDLGFIGRKGIGGDFSFMNGVETSGGQEMDKAMRAKVTRAAKNRWKALYEYSRESDYAVQWTGLPAMSDGLTGWNWLTPSTDRLNQRNNIAIDAVMNTQPIINGTIRPMSALDGLDLDKELGIYEGMDEIDIQGIRDNAEEASMIRWKEQNLIPGKKTTMNLAGLPVERFDAPSMFNERYTKDEADLAIQALLNESADIYDAKLPDPDKQDAFADAALHNSGKFGSNSIFTHDNNTHRLLEPISKAFENGNGNGAIIMDNSSNSSSVVKQGDTVQMPLGIHTTDPTAHAFHEWKYA